VTRMIGKWHLGFEMYGDGPRKTFEFSKPLVGGPLDCGFDSFFGLTKAPSGPPYFYIRGRMPVDKPTETTPGTKRDLKANGKDSRTAYAGGDIAPGFVPEQCNAAFSDEAVKIVNDHAELDQRKPLFLYYAMLEPHVPWLPGDAFAGKSKAGPYGDYIVQLDYEVGRVLAALKETGLEKDTLVIFSSDNGAMWRPQDIEQFGHRANGIFSGTKGTAYEGGHRVPFIARWPDYIPASTVSNALINHSDLFATLADHFKVDLGKAYPGNAEDSHSFLAVLNDPADVHRRPGMIVTPGSYRLGDWKLRFRRGGGATDHPISEAMLHNLSKDPGELNDLSDSNAATKSRMFAEYRAFVEAQHLKPLAVQVAARKSEKKTRRSQTRPEKKGNDLRSGSRPVAISENLSEEQRARVDRLTKEHASKIAELQKKLDDVLTDVQKESRRSSQKKSLAEGLKGVKLRAASDAAANMTNEQKNQVDDLRRAIAKLSRERRAKLQAIVTEKK
jgi:arylsulfatase A